MGRAYRRLTRGTTKGGCSETLEVAELKARGVTFEEYEVPGLTMRNGIMTAGGAKTALS